MAAFDIVIGCVMVLLALLYNVSSGARYHIKFTVFTIYSMFAAIIPVPLMLRRPRDPRNALLPAAALRPLASMLGITWEVRGTENVDNSKGAVVVINHQTALDLFVLAILWPLMYRAKMVAKRAVLYLVPFGPATWLWGTIFIDRGSAAVARKSINTQVDAVKDKKAKLMLFPEGTRSSGDRLLPFRKGAFHAAVAAQAPIQPVVVSRYHFVDGQRKFFGSGKLIITILPLIETEGKTKDDITPLLEDTYSLMQECYTRTSKETLDTCHTNQKAVSNGLQ